MSDERRPSDEEYAAFKRSEYERIRPAFLTPAHEGQNEADAHVVECSASELDRAIEHVHCARCRVIFHPDDLHLMHQQVSWDSGARRYTNPDQGTGELPADVLNALESIDIFTRSIMALSDDEAVSRGTIHPDLAAAIRDLAKQTGASGVGIYLSLTADRTTRLDQPNESAATPDRSLG